MQIKTTRRYHLTPVGELLSIIFYQTDNKVLARLWRKRNLHALLVGT